MRHKLGIAHFLTPIFILATDPLAVYLGLSNCKKEGAGRLEELFRQK